MVIKAAQVCLFCSQMKKFPIQEHTAPCGGLFHEDFLDLPPSREVWAFFWFGFGGLFLSQMMPL